MYHMYTVVVVCDGSGSPVWFSVAVAVGRMFCKAGMHFFMLGFVLAGCVGQALLYLVQGSEYSVNDLTTEIIFIFLKMWQVACNLVLVPGTLLVC